MKTINKELADLVFEGKISLKHPLREYRISDEEPRDEDEAYGYICLRSDKYNFSPCENCSKKGHYFYYIYDKLSVYMANNLSFERTDLFLESLLLNGEKGRFKKIPLIGTHDGDTLCRREHIVSLFPKYSQEKAISDLARKGLANGCKYICEIKQSANNIGYSDYHPLIDLARKGLANGCKYICELKQFADDTGYGDYHPIFMFTATGTGLIPLEDVK